LGVHLTSRRFESNSVRTTFDNTSIILVCPLTYMNESGRAVKAFAGYYGISDEEILVIHDDLDLPLGRVRVVKNGGAGGHKGVLSVIQHLGTKGFPRVRVGIGRPRYGENIDAFVLSRFYKDEREIVEEVIAVALQACKSLLSGGVARAMTEINCRRISATEKAD
jgi:PTH1 family peptidyl-tRNA hydrolase